MPASVPWPARTYGSGWTRDRAQEMGKVILPVVWLRWRSTSPDDGLVVAGYVGRHRLARCGYRVYCGWRCHHPAHHMGDARGGLRGMTGWQRVGWLLFAES